MSLAPANSRGAFLKARLAVNGIQCAARSFGTLTAGRGGLLSNMGASSAFGAWGWRPSYQLRPLSGTAIDCDISAQSAEVGCRNPECFALRILSIEPQQRQLRVGGLERFAAAADLAQQSALRCEVRCGLVEDTPDNV